MARWWWVAAVPGGLPRMEGIGVDSCVLVFTPVVSPLTGIVFGLTPALQVSRVDLHGTLKEGRDGT
jgi:putative ABC transport system permease protein